MSKYTLRRGVQQSLSQRLFAEYLEELAQKRIDKENKKPRITSNKRNNEN